MLQLNQFLEHLNNQQLKSVVVFTGSPDNFPLLLLAKIAKKISVDTHTELKKIEFAEVNTNELTSIVNSSFLGSSLVYWITGVENPKASSQIIAQLDQYEGPHQILLFVARECIEKITNKNFTIVDIPLYIEKKNYITIAKLLYNLSQQDAYATDLFTKIDKITTDQCCTVLNYIQVLGVQSPEFLTSAWLENLIEPDKSLFMLSQFFFAKDEKNFFNLWNLIKDAYNEMFWLSFWSEQIWRAYYVTLFHKKNLMSSLKKMSFRLPFSFVQKQCKDYSLTELKNAHNFMYDLDYGLKNGLNHISIEDFYTAFFCDTFKNL